MRLVMLTTVEVNAVEFRGFTSCRGLEFVKFRGIRCGIGTGRCAMRIKDDNDMHILVLPKCKETREMDT
jgi:hypothetical protein